MLFRSALHAVAGGHAVGAHLHDVAVLEDDGALGNAQRGGQGRAGQEERHGHGPDRGSGGRAASAASCSAMRDVLLRQTETGEIPAGLPPGTRIAHKTGWITATTHDALLPAMSSAVNVT